MAAFSLGVALTFAQQQPKATGESGAAFQATYGNETKIIARINRTMNVNADGDNFVTLTYKNGKTSNLPLVPQQGNATVKNLDGTQTFASRRVQVFRLAVNQQNYSPDVGFFVGEDIVMVTRDCPSTRVEQTIAEWSFVFRPGLATERTLVPTLAGGKDLARLPRIDSVDLTKRRGNFILQIGGSDDYVFCDAPGFTNLLTGVEIGPEIVVEGTAGGDPSFLFASRFETFIFASAGGDERIHFNVKWGSNTSMNAKATVATTTGTVVLKDTEVVSSNDPDYVPLDVLQAARKNKEYHPTKLQGRKIVYNVEPAP